MHEYFNIAGMSGTDVGMLSEQPATSLFVDKGPALPSPPLPNRSISSLVLLLQRLPEDSRWSSSAKNEFGLRKACGNANTHPDTTTGLS